MISTLVQYGTGGWHVEFYRETDHPAGEVSYWYGSREDCEKIAQVGKLPKGNRWYPNVERTETFSADWCERQGDNY